MPSTAAAAKQYHLVVYGATSFAGRLVAEYLRDNYTGESGGGHVTGCGSGSVDTAAFNDSHTSINITPSGNTVISKGTQNQLEKRMMPYADNDWRRRRLSLSYNS
jgi:hypothetical protein